MNKKNKVWVFLADVAIGYCIGSIMADLFLEGNIIPILVGVGVGVIGGIIAIVRKPESGDDESDE